MTLDERFDHIAEVVPAIIWVTNVEGECIYINQRWSEFTGRPRELDSGAAWLDALHPDDRAASRPIVAQAVAERRSYSLEYRVRRSDGAYRWMLDRGTPRFAADGSYLGYVGTVVDITERKVAEESLRWSESRFRSLAESVPHIMWTLLPNGSLQHLNDRVTVITGRSSDQAPAVSWLNAIHPDDVRPTLEAWRVAHRRGAVFEIEHRLRHVSGSYCWYLSRAVPHSDHAGSVRLWYGTSTDVHQLKEVEHALRDSRGRLDTALAASQSGTFRWDIRRDVLDWDENLYRVFGRDGSQPVTSASDPLRWIHPEDRAMYSAAVDRIRRDGLDFIHEFRVLWPNGAIHWLSQRSAVERDAQGRPHHMIGACTDITVRKTAELALQEAKNDSERTNAAKDRFLAVLSHELRTPLNPVKMILEMLATEERLPDDVHALIETARRNVDTQARLIDDLLDVTRIASGKLRIERTEVHLHEILRNVIDVCCEEIAKKELNVGIAFEANDDLLFADAQRLSQVFWNLVRNAAKFTPAGGSISITTVSTDESIRIEVADTGIGIPPEQVRRIFDLFAQAPADRRQGLGLGLSIGRSIVELHEGTIAAQSEGLGRGTTIVVELPLRNARSKRGADSELRRLRILLVEDDNVLREAVAMWLESRGYTVVQAASAEEAMRLFDAADVQVVISDVYLPNATGFDLLRYIRRRRDVHAIAMSGSGESADIVRGRTAGFDSYLVKPLDLDRLLGEIDTFARRKQAQP
jgi:PAS domain S-box-containing protein